MRRLMLGTLSGLVPIVFIVAFFQIVVLRQPVEDIGGIALGLVFVMLGLAVFLDIRRRRTGRRENIKYFTAPSANLRL